MQLAHWVKQDQVDQPYPFARFNKVLESFTFSDGEYEQHLKSAAWTREQTDYLMQVAVQFDLRFGGNLVFSLAET